MKLIKTFTIILLGILLFAGCSEEGANTGSSPGGNLVSISISPSNPVLAPEMTLQISAIGSNTDGSLLDLTATVNWTSSDDTIASVNAEGVVTAASAGTAIKTAVSGDVSATMTLTVNSPASGAPLAYITISPANPTLASGSMLQMQAIGTYTDGSTGDLTSAITWESNDPDIAAVDSTGLLTGVNRGTTGITATSGDISSSTIVTTSAAYITDLTITHNFPVISIGASHQFTATAAFSNGSTANVTPAVTWSASMADITPAV